MSDVQEPGYTVRQARDEDGTDIRRVVTTQLLAGGFDAPDPERDADLLDPGHYREPGRGAWVAVLPEGRVIGYAALDRGQGELAVLRRLAGEGMVALTRTAVTFAEGRGYRGIEIVLPAAMSDARSAVASEGFTPAGPHNELLFRLPLRG